MQNSWKRLFQRLLFCSPLVILPLQAAPTAINLPELGEPLGRPSLEELLPLQQLEALTSQWLSQFGQAEIALSDPLSGSALRTGRLALLLPLYRQSHQLILTQWRVLRDRQQTTLDFGIGQRFFNQAQGYWGYNVFYDYHRQGNHGGLGLGLEQRGATCTVAVNGYLPLSGWRIAEDQRGQSRPAKGIDLRLQHQLPKYPQWQLNAVLEHYFAQSLVSVHEQPPPRATAFMLGFDYTPIPLLTTSYAYQLASGGLRNHQLQLRLIYRLGVPWGQQLDPTQVAPSLASNHCALIQRHAPVTSKAQRVTVQSNPIQVAPSLASNHYALIQRHAPVTSKAQRVTAQSNNMLVHVPQLPAVYQNNVRVDDAARREAAVEKAEEDYKRNE